MLYMYVHMYRYLYVSTVAKEMKKTEGIAS